MFNFPVILFVTAIFSVVHIGFWHMFPRKFKHMLFANPILAFMVDFAGSGLITMFTGVASFVGICNLGASVVFGLYAVGYIVYHGIRGIRVDWYRIWIIPIFPRLMVVYCKDGKTWAE